MSKADQKKIFINWFIRHKYISRFILIIMGIFTPILCLEIGSHLVRKFPFVPDPLITESLTRWTDSRTFDPLLFWKLKPNIKIRKIETNSLGLRGKEISRHKKKEFRILSLGESTTYGLGLKYEETYSSVIEKEIGYLKDKHLCVINAGIPGYTLFQGYAYLKYRGIKLKPDAVMIYFGYNDFLPVAFLSKRDAMSTEETKGYNDWELFKKRQAFTSKASFWLAKRSNFVRGIMSLLRPNAKSEVIREHQNKVRVPEEHRKKLLKMFIDFCREKDIHFVMIVPWYFEFTRHITLLREFALTNNVFIVDLNTKFSDLPEPKNDYFRDRFHPNKKGHRLIGKAIAEELSHLW